MPREEASTLLPLVQQGLRIYVDGPRRCGKTTLANNTLEAAEIKTLNLNLDGICTVPKLIESIASQTEGFLRDYPSVRKDLTGKQSAKAGVEAGFLDVLKFSLEAKSEDEKKMGATLDSLLSAVSVIAKHAGAAVIVDEFQAIKHKDMEHPSEVLGSFARASDADKGKVAWIFLGSDRYAMHNIFSEPESAFYQRTRHLPVGVIPKNVMIPFLNKRSQRQVESAVGDEAFKWTEGIPGDLQRLYSAMIVAAGDSKRIMPQHLIAAKASVLKDIGASYAITLQGVAKKDPELITMLNLVARDDIRDCDTLAAACDKTGIGGDVADKRLNQLLDMGLLHFRHDNQHLERPEPLLFHYLASFPGHDPRSGYSTASSALAKSFRKISKPKSGQARTPVR